MEPIAFVVVAGILGGLAIAGLSLKRGQRRQPNRPSVGVRDQLLSTDVINMARIRVAGVGGLGLVAMAGVVAWGLPRVGQTVIVGAVLGTLLAVALIVSRRRAGPMPSSGQRAGANVTLSIDQQGRAGEERSGQSPTQNARRLGSARYAV